MKITVVETDVRHVRIRNWAFVKVEFSRLVAASGCNGGDWQETERDP